MLNKVKNLTPILEKEMLDCIDWITKNKPIPYKMRYFSLTFYRSNKIVKFKYNKYRWGTFLRESDSYLYAYILGDLDTNLNLKAQELLYDRFEKEGGSDLRFEDGSGYFLVDKYDLILPKLRELLTSYDSRFEYGNKKVYYSENRRFGFKNGRVFFYKGANKTEMRIGKAIKKLTKIVDITLDDNDIKKIFTMIENVDKPLTLDVVEGDDIKKYYSQDEHSILQNLGTLAQSCMRYDYMSSYFDIYRDNAKMLVLFDGSRKVCGRAILWEADCGTKIMDRVYGSEANYQFFFDWAIENDYVRKRYQSYDSSLRWVLPNGEEVERYYEIIVGCGLIEEYSFFPYMDTFCAYSSEYGRLFNDRYEDGVDFIFRETDGSYADR